MSESHTVMSHTRRLSHFAALTHRLYDRVVTVVFLCICMYICMTGMREHVNYIYGSYMSESHTVLSYTRSHIAALTRRFWYRVVPCFSC